MDNIYNENFYKNRHTDTLYSAKKYLVSLNRLSHSNKFLPSLILDVALEHGYQY